MDSNQDKYYTELDMELQQLALVDWPTFIDLIGADAIISAKICLLKSRGKSLNQISQKLTISRDRVKYTCGTKCGKNSPKK